MINQTQLLWPIMCYIIQFYNSLERVQFTYLQWWNLIKEIQAEAKKLCGKPKICQDMWQVE